jgi:hypothetical protein
MKKAPELTDILCECGELMWKRYPYGDDIRSSTSIWFECKSCEEIWTDYDRPEYKALVIYRAEGEWMPPK